MTASRHAADEVFSLPQYAPDETTIFNFRHLLEQHDLCEALLNAVNHY
jgi:hypothetical protein